ncbi:MAG TPA: ATP-binding protein [Actinophytocola sp.]|uniref:sensor histidine kinase n=1 Tax=Actinophytocola sp. TaxID=1872138 RepID=UPI002F938443
MTASQPGPPRQRYAGLWICVGAVTAYVLASPFFLRNSADGATWVILWVALGVAAIALVTTGALLANRTGREHLDELQHLDEENADLAALAETRRAALENIVDHQLPALNNGHTPPALPDPGGDDVTSTLLGRAVDQLGRVREDQLADRDAVQAAVVALGRKVQASAHRIQEEAARMVQRHPTDADVLQTSMRVDHAAAQQARNAQSLAALCGEWPGQQWHEALPLADVVRGAAGRITAYQRVEVSGDPGVAVSARVVEPLVHMLAELLANATQSSPPTTQVLVSLRHVQRGAVIEIDDGGVGLDDSRLEQVREIASGRRKITLADLGEIPQTGLPVVGAYVRRHGFRVDITESVYGGLRAIVLVPADLTEPVAPAGMVAGGGHVLTRRAERKSIPEPAPKPLPETLPESMPRRGAQHVRADDDVAAVPTSGELPELPRRRSRRAEAARKSEVDWPSSAEPDQTAEQAGEWMGAFLSSAGDLEEGKPDDDRTDDTREEQG